MVCTIRSRLLSAHAALVMRHCDLSSDLVTAAETEDHSRCALLKGWSAIAAADVASALHALRSHEREHGCNRRNFKVRAAESRV